MQVNKVARFSVTALFFFSAVFHLVVGYSLLETEVGPSIIDLVFGVVYIILGIGIYSGKRIFSYLSLLFALIDCAGGISAHFASQALAPLVAAVIDVVIILLCIYLILEKNDKGKEKSPT